MIILTGGAGFIGSRLLKKLNSLGEDRILVVDHLSDSQKWKNLVGKKFESYTPKNKLFDALEQLEKIKAVFHLGACSSTTEKNMDYLYTNNVEYSKKLFQYCTKGKIPFLYASSASVYGDGEEGYSDEHQKHSEYTPLNPYGFSKHLFDTWALKQKNTPPLWFGLRFFNVYGKSESHKGFMRSVASKAYEEIKETGHLKLFRSHKKGYEDGEQKRDFIYVEDVVNIMVQLWKGALKENSSKFSGIYNLGTGKARSFHDLGRAVFKALNQKEKIEWIPMPEHLRDQYQYFTEAPMEKLNSLPFVDYQFHSLEEGILKMKEKEEFSY